MSPLPSKKEIKELCMLGEKAAREHVLSAIDRRLVRLLNVRVVSEISESGLAFDADVEIEVDPVVGTDIKGLADAAAERALSTIDCELRARKSG